MQVIWTDKGLSDLDRLHEFLAHVNRAAAKRVVQTLLKGVARLSEHPRLGEKLSNFSHDEELRRIIIGHYELRYQLSKKSIYILRIWHTREQRPLPETMQTEQISN